LQLREAWLARRAERFSNLSAAMELGEWGGEVVSFLRKQVDSERKWTAGLRKKAAGGKISGKGGQDLDVQHGGRA
jgi:hypothetical protein